MDPKKMGDSRVSFGEWLKERRKLLDLTQTELADRVGCSVMTIRKIEADERRPSRQLTELLAGCLEITPEDQPTFIKAARLERLPQSARTLNVSSLSDKPAPAAAPPRSLASLPTPPTPLVGREPELATIRQLLQEPHCRLLSLIGPGGIGKTRLAIAAAPQLEGFEDGFFFVALAPLSGSEFIVPTIAAALGFTFYGATEPQVQLLNYLREKRLLLILDNLEHLLAGVNFLATLLQQAPALKLLVTSRERLNLQGEWVFEVHGLPVPAGETISREGLEENSAVRLFVQSAQRAQLGFELPPEEGSAVARICRLMEGLPLGLELAAAWVRLLSCREIAQEIERNLDFLSASTRNVSTRHHSIRAVFDHSWKLLSTEEQRVLRQLSVFRGGFRREAAIQVTGASLQALAGLVDKSLISLTVGGRYHLHELLRQFSTEKLDAETAEQAATHTRHSDYFLGFLQEREAGLTGKAQKIVLDEIQAEVENVRMGWNWAVSQGQVEAINRALDSLYLFYWRRSYYQEGEETFRRTVEHLQPGKLYMKAQARRGAFCMALGRYEVAKALLQNSLELARRWAVQAEMVFCLNVLATVPLEQEEDYLTAEQLYQESLVISQATGDRLGMAETLERLGRMATGKGDFLDGKRYLQQSLDLLREMENQSGLASVLDALGMALFFLGENSASEQCYQESLALFKEIGDRLGMALAIGGLGLVAWREGGVALNEAKQFFEESLALCREIGHQSHVHTRLVTLGHISNSLGRYKEAEGYFQEAWELSKQLGRKAEVSMMVAGLGGTALALGDFGAARRYLLEALETPRIPIALEALVTWATLLKQEADQQGNERGQKQQAVEILSLALDHPALVQMYKDKAARLLAELEAELPPEVVIAAREQARTQTVAEMVAKIVGKTGS